MLVRGRIERASEECGEEVVKDLGLNEDILVYLHTRYITHPQ